MILLGRRGGLARGCWRFGPLDEQDPVLDARRKRRHASRLDRRPLHGPRLQIDFPGVERAHHRRACDDAVAQRPAVVRTAVVDGEIAVAEIEDRHLAVADADGAPFTRRNVPGGGDSNPVRAHGRALTVSSAWMGMNCVGCTGVCPSSQASRARAFDFRSRSSNASCAVSGAYTVSFRILSMPIRSTKSYVRSR